MQSHVFMHHGGRLVQEWNVLLQRREITTFQAVHAEHYYSLAWLVDKQRVYSTISPEHSSHSSPMTNDPSATGESGNIYLRSLSGNSFKVYCTFNDVVVHHGDFPGFRVLRPWLYDRYLISKQPWFTSWLQGQLCNGWTPAFVHILMLVLCSLLHPSSQSFW